MTATASISRRDFIKTGVAAGGGLILGMYLPGRAARAAGAAQAAAGAAFAPNAFLRIAADESVTVIVNHSEMGQGVYTALPMLVAEELDADWSKVRYEAAPVDAVYNHTLFGMQMVGGSTSTWTEWERLRRAGATARAMLVEAAAMTWQVEPSTCRTESGYVIHDASGRRLSYGSLADKASVLQVPQVVTLKGPKSFKLIGKPTKRLDTPEKINGKGLFGIDVSVPNMLTAVVARPPVFGAELVRFDDSKAKAVPGVRHVVQIDRGVAVVAGGYWAAQKGREALGITWDEGPLATLDSKAQREHYAQLAQQQPGVVARSDGDAPAALSSAARTIEAVYEVPYLAHATMEPLNCVADVRADSCEVWTGTQFQTADRMAAAQETGLPPEKVTLHTMLLGGGFGRRAVADSHFVREAVQVSKAIKAPVKVIWSREDDIRGGFYRPAAYHSLAAGLDANSNPVSWRHCVVCQSFIIGSPFEAAFIENGLDHIAVEGPPSFPTTSRTCWWIGRWRPPACRRSGNTKQGRGEQGPVSTGPPIGPHAWSKRIRRS